MAVKILDVPQIVYSDGMTHEILAVEQPEALIQESQATQLPSSDTKPKIVGEVAMRNIDQVYYHDDELIKVHPSLRVVGVIGQVATQDDWNVVYDKTVMPRFLFGILPKPFYDARTNFARNRAAKRVV